MGPMVFWIGSILESFIFTRLNSRRLYKDLADRGYKLKYMDDQEIKLEESPLYMHFIPFLNLLETAGSILEYNYLLDNTIEYFKNENMVSPMNQKEREYYRENPTVKTALMIAESDYQRRKFGNKIILKGDSSESIITYYYDFTDNSIGVYSVTGELSKLDDDDIMEITVTLLENSLYEYYEKYGGVSQYYQAIMDDREKNSIIIARGIMEAIDEADLEMEEAKKKETQENEEPKLTRKPKNK